MTTTSETEMSTLDFSLPPDRLAHEPPEARGLSRDGVRLMVGTPESVSHHRFSDLPDVLRPGDLLVVNTSAMIPAAVQVVDSDLWVHFSTELPDGAWIIELRQATGIATSRYTQGKPGDHYPLQSGGSVTLTHPYSPDRLWKATIDIGPSDSVIGYLHAHGSPIRYDYVPKSWPIRHYQTVFGITPGSAEMPSAARPFTDRLVTTLITQGVRIAPVLLHTGVASPEAHEHPYPERFTVPAPTADLINNTRHSGGRVIAVGTTVVRAVESAVTVDGKVAAAAGWTDLIITPDHKIQAVDGLLTGFHEPRASHLDMLAAIAGIPLLARCYQEALTAHYLWHEFGDINLLLP